MITTCIYLNCAQAVGRLGGSDMDEECTDLRMKYLDKTTVPWNIRGRDTTLEAR